MFDEWGCGQVTDCDHIERLEVVDEVKRFPVLLEYTKSVRVVGSGRWFVNTGCDVVFDDLDGISPHRKRNWNIS